MVYNLAISLKNEQPICSVHFQRLKTVQKDTKHVNQMKSEFLVLITNSTLYATF
jgi:hypothetical protein